jgi:hypothetical protein
MQRFSRKRNLSRSSRRATRTRTAFKKGQIQKTINRLINKKIETKYYDIANENYQLYHDIGYAATLPTVFFQGSIVEFFNPWANIPPGTGPRQPHWRSDYTRRNEISSTDIQQSRSPQRYVPHYANQASKSHRYHHHHTQQHKVVSARPARYHQQRPYLTPWVR